MDQETRRVSERDRDRQTDSNRQRDEDIVGGGADLEGTDNGGKTNIFPFSDFLFSYLFV